MSDTDQPIWNLDRFDVVGVRNDGGIDVVVSCQGPLDDSAQTLWLLGQKVRNYLREIPSEHFRTKYGSGPVRILISCRHDVPMAAGALIEALQGEATGQSVDLQVVRSVA